MSVTELITSSIYIFFYLGYQHFSFIKLPTISKNVLWKLHWLSIEKLKIIMILTDIKYESKET